MLKKFSFSILYLMIAASLSGCLDIKPIYDRVDWGTVPVFKGGWNEYRRHSSYDGEIFIGKMTMNISDKFQFKTSIFSEKFEGKIRLEAAHFPKQQEAFIYFVISPKPENAELYTSNGDEKFEKIPCYSNDYVKGCIWKNKNQLSEFFSTINNLQDVRIVFRGNDYNSYIAYRLDISSLTSSQIFEFEHDIFTYPEKWDLEYIEQLIKERQENMST